MRPIEPFRIVVPDQTLDDLAARLSRARLPSPPILEGGETPETIRRIEELLHYWRNGYDWRAQEHRLNELPHYRATVSGAGIHFVHAVGSGPDPLPLLLANGWPSSFVEYLGVLGPLTDPAAHGGDAADSFTVIIPALPGYGFSDRCLDRDVGRFWIAELFNRLMVEHLGYRRYVAHGDDIGGGVVNRIGMRHADAVVALQKANPLSPHFDGYAEPSLPAEHDFRAGEEAWDHTEGAYAHVQATRPQTLAYGLNDSPIGLAAWILEKLLTWSDPATRGKLAVDPPLRAASRTVRP